MSSITPVIITIKRNGKSKSFEVESRVLSYLFVVHSLALNQWVKGEKKKVEEKLNPVTESSDSSFDRFEQSVEWLKTELEQIHLHRSQVEQMEEFFTEAGIQ